MKKVGIVTIDSSNLGNKLQNYALQQTIASLGFDVETIGINKCYFDYKSFKKRALWFLLQTKGWKFYSFRKNITWSKYTIDDLCKSHKLSEEFCAFVIGSDQVWNPTYNFTSEAMFLQFAPEQKRISYAASLGVSDIQGEIREQYIKGLRSMSNISVRESAASDLIYDMTGIKAKTVLDPTLLLTKTQWNSVAKKPSFKIPKKYVLKYFLGDVTDEVVDTQNRIINDDDIQVLDIRLKNSRGRELAVGPAEFIYLIKNAYCILTDSFHGSVFSAIFNRPFVIFERQDKEANMSSRIDSLCATFNLSEHRFSSEKFIPEKVLLPNYTNFDNALASERENSLIFLKQSLSDK